MRTLQPDEAEQRWQAQNDAHTLANFYAIRADAQRLERAQSAAKEMVEENKALAKGFSKVLKLKSKKTA